MKIIKISLLVMFLFNSALIKASIPLERKEKIVVTKVKTNENESFSKIKEPIQISNRLKIFQGVLVSTPYGGRWTKIKISGSKIKIWEAYPTSGTWGDVYQECELKKNNDGDVRIAEQRSEIDGSKFYFVYTDNNCEINHSIFYFPSEIQKFRLLVGQNKEYNLKKVQDSFNPWR